MRSCRDRMSPPKKRLILVEAASANEAFAILEKILDNFDVVFTAGNVLETMSLA